VLNYPDTDIRDVSNAVSHMKPATCYISTESTIHNCRIPPSAQNVKQKARSNADGFPVSFVILVSIQ